MTTPYPKGAVWRKWDLHIHTPASYDYKDKGVSNNNIIDSLSDNDILVAAITDHHTIDIERINELQKIGKGKGIVILPGIEFLSDARGSDPIHFIGIFPENCNLAYIWGQIENRTAISKIEGESKNINEVYCDLAETAEIIHELGGIVTIHAGSKSNSIENITHSLPHSAAQKEDIAKFVDIFELGKERDIEEYKNKVVKFLKQKINKTHSLILCSDNHNANKYQLKANCWLKADPTFNGLKQVLIEPEGRIFIGGKPPLFDRIAKNRTRYIKKLSITQVEGYDERHGVWFKDVSIPLNSELVAIIGNKGSGKSAIADVLALCANYQPNEDFSFLETKKFKKKNLAENFTASITWESENPPVEINLNDQPENTKLLDIKYLPQGQFERLTNEIRTAEEFQREIESVVFSHIPESENLGARSFDELIEKKTSSVNSELESYKSNIRVINKIIIDLERKSTPAYRTEVENKLNKKQEELDALIEPPPVTNPNEDPEKKKLNEAVNNTINELKEAIQKIQSDIQSTESNKKAALDALQILKSVKADIQQKETEIARFIAEKESELSEFDINVGKLITIETDFTELDDLILNNDKRLLQAKKLLGEEDSTDESKSLPVQLEEKEAQLKAEKSKLDTEQQQYQQYLADKDKWNKDREAIIGSADRIDTLEFYKHELKYLDEELNSDLAARYEERRGIVRSIFDKKQEIISSYKDARDQLNKIIDDNQETLKDYRIKIDASLVKKADFNSRFLGFILQNKMGTFYNRDGGEAQLIRMLAEIDFDEKEAVLSFLDKLIEALRFDKRKSQNSEPRSVAEQVKDIPALYEYLFSLEFLEKNYQLKQGDKELEQLSPGERGALLLVFYLLLDNNDIPLIIDQPEDNLDNHSVATILVPFIRVAKEKRQIIMVTHNPNLAVVADAEQIIYVNLDKENNYKFSTISGSIEDKEVNREIVNVLEGAMPAFNTRKRKYYDQ